MARKKADTESTPVAAVQETEVKAPVKKTAAKKTAVKEPLTNVEEEAPKAAVKETPADVKEEAPKAAAKKPAARKTVAKKSEPETTVTIQFQGKEITAVQVVEAAKAAFTEANPDAEIKTMDVYVKPEEGVAYYAVNGEGSGDYKIEL